MLVDRQGKFLTQRKYPRMALIRPRLGDEGTLILSAPEMMDISLPQQTSGRRCEVTVWGDVCRAVTCGADVAGWLTDFLQIECELVFMPDDYAREVDQRYAATGDQVGFADGFPLLLIGQASLNDLNARLEVVVEMQRFRPNLVISTEEPFVEDRFSMIRIGDITFRVVKPCSRCTIPNVDPLTGIAGREPVATLATYRRWNNKIWFGQNMLHDSGGILAVGAPVEVLA